MAPNLATFCAMEITTFTEISKDFSAAMDRVVDDHMPIAITRQRGRPVVMVSLDDWNSMQETLYLMSSPNNAKRLLESIADAEAGRNMIEVDPETMMPL